MKYAEHIPYTNRKWRQLKREELRAVRKAVDAFRLGSAYVPGYKEFLALEEALKVLEHATSSSQWGH